MEGVSGRTPVSNEPLMNEAFRERSVAASYVACQQLVANQCTTGRKLRMTRLAKLFAAFWLVSCALAPLASANNIAFVDQSGSYSYTRFIQVGDRTRIKVRQIDPRKFERIQGHLAARVDRIAERAFARLSRSQSQNA